MFQIYRKMHRGISKKLYACGKINVMQCIISLLLPQHLTIEWSRLQIFKKSFQFHDRFSVKLSLKIFHGCGCGYERFNHTEVEDHTEVYHESKRNKRGKQKQNHMLEEA